MENATPNFELIKEVSPYGVEYWSAATCPLLGYTEWENFEVAIKRAKTSSKQIGQKVDDHFPGVRKMVELGSGAKREVKDYSLSRFAAYLIAQNGDPRKPEIAYAQAYFAVSTRENELQQLREEQQERLELRERVTHNNKTLAEAAHKAGVLSKFFGKFQNRGYEGLYNGMDVESVKAHKGVPAKEDLLDRMGRAELAANDFRITQTEEKLRLEGIVEQHAAMETHYQVRQEVRDAIKRIGGRKPEELHTEPSIKSLLDEKRRKTCKNLPNKPEDSGQDDV